MSRRSLVWTYVIVVHLVVLLLMLRIVQPQLGIWGPAGSPSAAEVHYTNMVDYHGRGDLALPPGRVVFLGDSLIQGLPVSSVTELGINYGIGSDDSIGLLERLDVYPSIESAAAVVVAMGSNDINHYDDLTFLANYEAVLDALPADVPVVCSAILPINEVAKENWLDLSNARIVSVNGELREMCEERGSLFSDATEVVLDDDGNLDSAFHVGDGLHLNAEGNERWITVLQSALLQIGISD